MDEPHQPLPPNLPGHVYIGFPKRVRITALPKTPTEVPVTYRPNWPQGRSLRYRFHTTNEEGVPVLRNAWLTGIDVPEFLTPYSVRSYILQMSQLGVVDEADRSCFYCCFDDGADKFGTRFIRDICYPFHEFTDEYWLEPKGRLEERYCCGFAKGWPNGAPTPGICPLWDYHRERMQTQSERLFFFHYLLQNRDREAPMLLPQAWTDDTERHRADFMLFVEGQHAWRKIVVEILGPSHKGREQLVKDAQRKRRTMLLGYEFIEFWTEEIESDATECVRQLRDFISLR